MYQSCFYSVCNSIFYYLEEVFTIWYILGLNEDKELKPSVDITGTLEINNLPCDPLVGNHLEENTSIIVHTEVEEQLETNIDNRNEIENIITESVDIVQGAYWIIQRFLVH